MLVRYLLFKIKLHSPNFKHLNKCNHINGSFTYSFMFIILHRLSSTEHIHCWNTSFDPIYFFPFHPRTFQERIGSLLSNDTFPRPKPG